MLLNFQEATNGLTVPQPDALPLSYAHRYAKIIAWRRAATKIRGQRVVVQFENWSRQGTLRFMLYMVIEHFKPGDLEQIAERFARCSRMLPEGLLYHSSWVDSAGTRCFQVMETTEPELLKTWMGRWSDLVDFEVVPVLTSADFWAKR